MNATRESPLIAIACASVEFKLKPLSAALQVLEKVPPYVDVSAVAVETTVGSGAGSATTDAELESAENADMVDIVEVSGLIASTGVAAFGVGAGAAIGRCVAFHRQRSKKRQV
jgi:hypothetical protein